jgi:hypothetical protein
MAKVNQNNNVMKALAPEELTEISNCISLLQDVVSMSQAGLDMGQDVANEGMDASIQNPAAGAQMSLRKAATEPMENIEATPEDDVAEPTGKPDDVKMAKKAIENTPGDSPDAADPYEERMEDHLPEGSEEALMEVAKALRKMMGGKSVRKSAPVNPLVQVQSETAKVIKSQQEQINGIYKALDTICEGLGINKQLEIAQKAQVKEPIVSQDANAVMKQLAELISGNKVNKSEPAVYGQSSQANIVRKNLTSSSLMQYLGAGDGSLGDDEIIE